MRGDGRGGGKAKREEWRPQEQTGSRGSIYPIRRKVRCGCGSENEGLHLFYLIIMYQIVEEGLIIWNIGQWLHILFCFVFLFYFIFLFFFFQHHSFLCSARGRTGTTRAPTNQDETGSSVDGLPRSQPHQVLRTELWVGNSRIYAPLPKRMP